MSAFKYSLNVDLSIYLFLIVYSVEHLTFLWTHSTATVDNIILNGF